MLIFYLQIEIYKEIAKFAMNRIKTLKGVLNAVKEQQANNKLVTAQNLPVTKVKIRSKSLPIILFSNNKNFKINQNGASKNPNIQKSPFNKNYNNKSIDSTKSKTYGRKNTNNVNKKKISTSKFIKRKNVRSWSSSPDKNRSNKRKLPIVLDFKNAANQVINIENFDAKPTVKFFPVPIQQEKSPAEMSSVNGSAKSKASYVAFGNMNVHEHNHQHQPHLHSYKCNRFASGLDKNRDSRFYFTKQTTAVRVYLSYNEKLAENQIADTKEDKSTLNGRKLSARTLKNQLKISPHLIEEAKNYIFVKETLSLIPQMLPLPPLTTSSNSINNITFQHLTMAEMAVMPLNNSVQTPSNNIHSGKHKSHAGHSKKSKYIPTALSPHSVSPK